MASFIIDLLENIHSVNDKHSIDKQLLIFKRIERVMEDNFINTLMCNISQ